jgi:hypothetical protein
MRAATLGILLTAWACPSCTGDFPMESAPTEESTAALTNTSGWSLWPTHAVPVCFASATWNDTSLAVWRSYLPVYLATSISAAANLDFTGFGVCGSNTNNMLTVTVDRSKGNSSGSGGWRGANAPTPMVFGLDGIADTSARMVILHEFMHSIGFDHEFERVENLPVGDCHFSYARPGDNMGTPYDHYSITNSSYCGNWNSLSPWDTVGLRNAYGKRPELRGFMIKSDRNSGLAINAWGGAAEGTVLRLSDACSASNSDCTWTYLDGMLLSDTNARLAINAWGGATEGGNLRLTASCTRSNPDCTWTYKKGMFVSDRNPALAINAWGGATNGATLLTTAACNATNADCTWTLPKVLISVNRNSTLNWNATGGAALGTAVKLVLGCNKDNPDCTWTFKNGMIFSDKNPSLAVNAWGGAVNLAPLKLHNACTSSNPDCTWQWHNGELLSDKNTTLAVNAYNGAAHGTQLVLHSACTSSNPDCLFWSRLAKD